MDVYTEYDDRRFEIKRKLRQYFDGRIVRKDLTKKIKEGANVPVYVLEFLLGQYCSSDDEEIIEKGVENVKRILADNFVRPDEAQKTLSLLRSRGSCLLVFRSAQLCAVAQIAMAARSGVELAEDARSFPSPLFPARFQDMLAGAGAVFTASEDRIREFALESLELASPAIDRIRTECREAMPKVARERYKRAFDAFTAHFAQIGKED